MHEAARRLLNRLDGVRQMGAGRWLARCPAHDDRSPSLSVRAAGDKVLLHCFAGCAAKEVLDALGLSWRDLYSDPWTAAKRAATARQGRRFKPLEPIDLLELERMVVKIARGDLAAGKTLSVEDKARMEVAIERLCAAGEEA